MNICHNSKHFLNVLLLIVALLGINTNAWGKHFYARCEVKSQPSQGGFVYVSQSPKEDDSYSFVNLTSDITGTKESSYHTSRTSSTNLDFCGYQKANSGYSFKGWSTNKNATSGMTDQKDHKYNWSWGSYHNNCKYYELTVTATSTSESSPTIGTYYAIFTPNKYTVVLKPNKGTGEDQTIYPTYDAGMPGTLKNGGAIVAPTRTNYVFDGYYDAAEGGTKYYNANLTSAHVWDKAADNVSLYAHWVDKLTPSVTCTKTTLLVEEELASAFTFVNTDGISWEIINTNVESPINNGDGQVIAYNEGQNKVIAHNAGAATIRFTQSETSTTKGRVFEFNFTVSKRSNSISCSWGAEPWTKNLNFDQGEYVSFTTSNTNYTATPVVVSQTDGTANATYYPDQGAIYASHNIGSATWSVYQPEDYKYVATDTKTLTVNIGTISTECYVLNDTKKYELHTIQKGPAFELTGPGDKLYLDAWKDLIAIDYGLPIQYSTDGVNFYDLTTIDLSNESKTFGPFTLPNGTTHILLESRTGSTLVKYYKNLRVTRKKWLKIQDKNANDIDEITMPVNTVGDNNKTANFYINYSTCADEIKVVSNHPRVTVSETTFKSDGNGNKQITLTYTGSVPESLEALITVYTPSENKTLKVYAQTVRQTQTLLWSTGYEESTVYLPVGLSDANPATASSGLTPVLYSTNNSDIIRIADDGQSFSITGIGTATLTATQAGDADRWNPVSETKTINATDKKIQVIHWEQNFSRSIAPGDLKDLLAEVYINNPLTGTQTKSDERTALIQYSCPENNGVISLSGNQMTVLDYGTTSITASVAGNENYEAATMTLLVNVRAPSAGCEDPLIVNHTEQIQIFSMNIDWTDWTTPPVIGDTIFFDEALGKPDKLSFQHEGEEYPIPVVSNIKVYRGAITVQQRVNGNWLIVPGSEVTPTKYEWNMLSGLQLDENADAIRFVRLVRGQGYHNIKDVQVTLLQYLRADEENIDLGNVQAGATLNAVIGFDYSNLKGDLSVSKLPAEDTYLSFDETIEVDCGSQGHHNFPISFTPKTIGDWEGDITITEPISSKSIIVHLTATVTKGSQSIQWGATTSICANEAPILNATATSNLPVSYAVTAGADVAEIVDGEVVINKTTGSFTITASQTGDVNYFAAENLVKTFTLITPTSLVLTAPIADDIIYPAELGTSALSGGAATANGTPVSGSWTWKEPTTILNPGEAQEIAVIFTPSANECLYTGFETTATINVKRAQFVFNGSGTEADDPNHVTWCYDDNWEENQKPSSEDKVLIDHNVVIRQEVSVYSVTINEGDTLTIMPTGGLTVGAGGIIGATTGNLILKAGTEGKTKGQTGYLRISPEYTGAMPQATVELYSTAYYDMTATNYNEDGKWQFVGSPLHDGVAAKTIFSQSFLYEWMTATGSWKNNRKSCMLQPFTGYATSQYMNTDGLLITFAGNLVQNEDHEINLAYNEGDEFTQNMIANSYSAPIDVTKFEDADFDNMQSAVYIFNTGSRADIAKLGEMRSGSCNIPGQYLSIPIGSAAAMKSAFETPTIIASMQGFCVHATGENAKLRLDYGKLVWDGDYATNRNTPLHISAREHEAEQVYSLCVSLYGEGVADNLYMLESNQYDIAFENGYDAIKMNSGDANIFAVAGEDKLAVDATNSIIGTRVGVRTGAETAYTFVFSHLQSENGLALYDAETEQTIDIDENTEYTFFAAPETEITNRFQIVARADAPAITTGVDGVENEAKAVKFIKDDQIYILKNGVLYNAMGAVVR